MSIRNQIVHSTSRAAGIAILTAALRKPGIGGRTKNRLRRSISVLNANLRSDASRRAAATLRAKREAAKTVTVEPVSKTTRQRRKLIEAVACPI